MPESNEVFTLMKNPAKLIPMRSAARKLAPALFGSG
jgi:hypothetical protein